MKQIAVVLLESQIEKLNDYSKEIKWSRNQLIREAITDYICRMESYKKDAMAQTAR